MPRNWAGAYNTVYFAHLCALQQDLQPAQSALTSFVQSLALEEDGSHPRSQFKSNPPTKATATNHVE